MTTLDLSANLAQYQRDGYTIVRGLFSPSEVTDYVSHFMELRQTESLPGDFAGVPIAGADHNTPIHSSSTRA